MNLGLDREETAADRSSQSVDADAMVTWVGPWPSAGVPGSESLPGTLFSSKETDSC